MLPRDLRGRETMVVRMLPRDLRGRGAMVVRMLPRDLRGEGSQEQHKNDLRLLNNASGSEIELPGRISAGSESGKPHNRPKSRF